MSLQEAVQGSPREGLMALRDKLAKEIDAADGREIAPLAKQLADVLKAIDALPSGKEVSAVDQLAAKRAARLTGTPSPDSSASGE